MRSGTHHRVAAAFTAWLIAVALIAGVPSAVLGQSIRGRVSSSERTPIEGALVELRDAAGKPLQSMLTSPSGGFQLIVAAPGRYWLRVAAIGYQPRASTAVDVPADGVTLGDILLDHLVMRLPDLIAAGRGRYCTRSGLPDGIFGRLLDGARTALQIIQATIESGHVRFQVAVVTTRTVYGAIDNVEAVDTIIEPLTRWPVQSIDPDTLRAVGFSRVLEPGDEGTRWYYGPDPRVLFSDWFLESHCFTLDRPDRKRVTDTLHLRFAPARKSALVDVAGELVLDAHDLSLLQFSFTLTNLPKWMPEDAAGGDMQFSRLASGLWMTRNWAMWAPREGISPRDRRISVAGEIETHGWVTKVFGADSAPPRP